MARWGCTALVWRACRGCGILSFFSSRQLHALFFFFSSATCVIKYRVCTCADEIPLFFGEGANHAFVFSFPFVACGMPVFGTCFCSFFFVGIGVRKEQELSIPSYCSERLFSLPTDESTPCTVATHEKRHNASQVYIRCMYVLPSCFGLNVLPALDG